MEELKRQTRVLTEDVERLAERTSALGDRLNKIDRDKRWLAASLLGVVVLVAMVAFVAFRTEKGLREQDELRGQVLCPFYALILGSYDPASRPEGDARSKYQQTFAVIQEGYAVLHCSNPIVPPRAPATN